jgi:hypothetical protein
MPINSKNSKSPKQTPPTLRTPQIVVEKQSKSKTPSRRTKGGVNLAPLISAVLLAAVRLASEKKSERLASPKSRSGSRSRQR